MNIGHFCSGLFIPTLYDISLNPVPNDLSHLCCVKIARPLSYKGKKNSGAHSEIGEVHCRSTHAISYSSYRSQYFFQVQNLTTYSWLLKKKGRIATAERAVFFTFQSKKSWTGLRTQTHTHHPHTGRSA